MVSWNTYQKCADDVIIRQQSTKSKSKFIRLFDEVKAMNKKPVGPTKGEWWFFAWGLVIGATLMGSMLTLMQVIGG